MPTYHMRRYNMGRKPKRARDKSGRYLGDNPNTPDRNEAYEHIVSSLSILESYKETIRKFRGQDD